VERLMDVPDQVLQPHQVVRLHAVTRCRTECLPKKLNPLLSVHGRGLRERCVVVAESPVHKMPILMTELVAIADVAPCPRACLGIAGFCVGGIMPNVIGPDCSKHENQLFSVPCRCARHAVSPVVD
jgi:hypothetical protein